MKTDLPLKRLTQLCPNDLLVLLGTPDATVTSVETLELPASESRLDTLLHLQERDGRPYLHLVEWQGYRDGGFLWRALSYLGWLGQNSDERPIRFTAIYLRPEDDVGDTLEQASTAVGGWRVQFHCLRLWQQDAVAALASGLPGLIALAPLMRGATTELVEQAAQTLISTVAQPAQNELLVILGVFAERLLDTERFIRLVTRERLMATDLISYLFKDQIEVFEQREAEREAKFVQEKAALEEKLSAQEAKLAAERALLVAATLQQTLQEAIVSRFPDAPIALTNDIRRINDSATLRRLINAIITAPDVATVQRLLAEA
ncbi:MAG: hypothetical protein MUD01_10075 [Chloroflexaceae bacterium]|jgi:hypothetical protein|nr:hypothetical protein [Chloroflexaceae bacterium]